MSNSRTSDKRTCSVSVAPWMPPERLMDEQLAILTLDTQRVRGILPRGTR